MEAESWTFPQFCRLPPELRLRIWEYSLPGTRIVPVRCGADALSQDSHVRQASAATACTTTTPCPANLHICSESRREAAKRYRCCFGFARQPGRMYFDPVRDVLYFGPRRGFMAADAQFRTCMALCRRDELAAVRRVAISDALFWVDDTWRSMTATSITIDILHIITTALPGLEQLTFVPREEDEARARAGEADLDCILLRIRDQVLTAMDTLLYQADNTWKPPNWRVMTLRALKDAAD